MQNEKGYTIISIRSDHGGEFDNDALELFCNENSFEYNFLTPKHHNKMVWWKGKNNILQEMARTMLNKNNLPKYFYAEVVNSSCHVFNQVLTRPTLNKTPYEL